MPESLDRNWQQMMMLYQERHQIIQDEIARLEKLQRLAEKINKEAQATDVKLDDIEACIEDEAKRNKTALLAEVLRCSSGESSCKPPSSKATMGGNQE